MFEELDDANKSVFTFFAQSILIIMIALPNVLIDIFFQQGRNANPNNMFIRAIIDVFQLCVSVAYIYVMFVYFNAVTKHFQTTLPGMFFPGMFFALQYGMIRDIHRMTTTLLGLKFMPK